MTTTLMQQLRTRFTSVFRFADKTQPVALLAVRVLVGLVFVFSGWGKLHGLEQVVGFFRELGIPFPELQAPFVATVEFVGGLAVLAGLGTRLVVLPLSATMVVAILTAKLKDVTGPTDLLFFSETDYLVAFFVLLAFGAGPLSLDALIARKRGLTPSDRRPLPSAVQA